MYSTNTCNSVKANETTFWMIRLLIKFPFSQSAIICMLKVSVADRIRFFNSWVVSKTDVNDKLIKVAFTGFTGRRPLVFTHVVTFSPVYKSPVCARQSISTHYHYRICGLLTERVWLPPQQADSTFVGWPLLFLASFSLPLSFSFFTCCFSSFSWAFFISFSLLLMVERSLWLETPSSWKATHISV